MSLVIDCSISVGWFLPGQTTPYTTAVSSYLSRGQGAHAWVPALWGIEFANVLRTACKRRKLDGVRAQEILTETMGLPIRFDPNMARPSELLALALRHDLTSYDAAYLDLAMRLQLPIATQDAALREAALASGAGLWQPG
jgi:predicted nucleic acid-binding protein